MDNIRIQNAVMEIGVRLFKIPDDKVIDQVQWTGWGNFITGINWREC